MVHNFFFKTDPNRIYYYLLLHIGPALNGTCCLQHRITAQGKINEFFQEWDAETPHAQVPWLGTKILCICCWSHTIECSKNYKFSFNLKCKQEKRKNINVFNKPFYAILNINYNTKKNNSLLKKFNSSFINSLHITKRSKEHLTKRSI